MSDGLFGVGWLTTAAYGVATVAAIAFAVWMSFIYIEQWSATQKDAREAAEREKEVTDRRFAELHEKLDRILKRLGE